MSIKATERAFKDLFLINDEGGLSHALTVLFYFIKTRLILAQTIWRTDVCLVSKLQLLFCSNLTDACPLAAKVRYVNSVGLALQYLNSTQRQNGHYNTKKWNKTDWTI